ncbi:sensor histidine kinase [Neglectibacter timonensis]|uniref:sensor histidine kinase n=1 Tax=Neglectibacter timonensis TaxID=1776382 RepID=UPI00266D1D52|nr:sensor histidine kinase [Neglectibacter timonensis]
MKKEKKTPGFWIRFLNRFTIKDKLLVTLVPVILLTFLIFLLTVYFISFRETQSIVNQQADISMNQKVQLVDTYLDKLRMETEVFMFDSNVQKKLKVPKNTLDDTKLDEMETDVRRDMYSMIINYDVNVESISVKTINDDYYVWKMDSRLIHGDFTGRINQHEDIARELDGGMLFTYEKLQKGLVTLTRLIKDPVADDELGTLMIDFNLGFLDNLSSSASWDRGAEPTLVIVNTEGSIVFNSSPFDKEIIEAVTPGTEKLKVSGSNFRIRHTSSGTNDWEVFLVINESKLYRNIYRLTFLQVGLVLFSIILVVLVIFGVSLTISRQFERFQKKISRTSDPKQHALIRVDSNDEFRDLAEVYNEMMGRIDNLIDTVYSKELLLKSAEIKAFQAQINPHFLYNTLDCINGLVEMNRPDDIKKTVTALASIMRMSIKGAEILTVRENLSYTEQYMYIEKIRYGDKLLFLSEIPESMMDYYMPKLIIQPLLENSIVHGISELLGKGMIGLFGREEEDAITFTVKDNGKGIPQNVIDLIESRQSSQEAEEQFSRESIGLQNIQSRIQLMYGKEYGLTIKNIPAGGSSVTIRLPKLTNDDIQKGGIAP